ncbi:MAG: Uma2 family endonuclease [Armatimonadetes bacterium]|nr:Uma2 family endonuclease [Armatimonadota bacterium]
MAIAPKQTQYLTYEEYLAEPEIMQRYDILDGVRHFMTNPTRLHQRVLMRICRILTRYEEESGAGEALIAPCDVLIRKSPLRTRQPDVLFISNERLAECKEETDPTPLLAAPELVVEILSPSENRRSVGEKLIDYCAIGVQECWLVRTEPQSIEVLRLTKEGFESAGHYNPKETFQSLAMTNLSVSVDEIFASE